MVFCLVSRAEEAKDKYSIMFKVNMHLQTIQFQESIFQPLKEL